jgi:diguanylate cyclase (GGDEF)-like protein/PAS domain S-box-containing protein
MDGREEGFHRTLLDNLHDGIYYVDRERRILYWNRAAERITGFPAEAVIGTRCSDNVLMHVDENGKQLCLEGCPLAATMEDGSLRETEVFLHHKKGHRVPVSVRTAPLRDDQGRIEGAVEIFTDLGAREAKLLRLQELERLAMKDGLTGLANRRYMENELSSRVDESRRYGVPFGVLFMDIDHFKEINDRYGHDAGDDVLRTVASTLEECARSFDVVGRWGGEEFVALVRNVDIEALGRIGERYRSLVARTLAHTAAGTIQATVSVGGTLLAERDSMDDVLGRADALMYRSKEEGRNRVTVG